MIIAQIATKSGRRPYPIIKPAEDMPNMPETGAQARAFEAASQMAFGLGLQFKRQQEEDRIETDRVSALNAQVALDKYDYDEVINISSLEFGQIEDFDNAYNKFNKGRQSYINTLLSGKTEDVKQSINDHALKTEVSSQSRYYNQLDRFKTQFSQTQFFDNHRTIAQGVTPDNIEQTKVAMLANIDAYKDFFTPNQVNTQKAAVENDINTAIAEYQYQEISNEALRVLADPTKGLQAAKDFIMAQDIDTEIKKKIISDINFEYAQQQDRLEIAIQEDENKIFALISTGQPAEDYINGSRVLDADTKWKWRQREQAEAARLAKGEDIVTDNEISSNLYSGIFQVLTGAKTKQEVLEQAKEARLDGSLSQPDYETFEKAINAQYEQAYTYQMGQVNRIAEGLLLNPDSLGYIKNAPIRYKTLGDFRKEWLQWISDKGDTIKISEIYPEGMRMAASHQISDPEAERQEVEMNKRLAEREATIWPKMPTDKKILEAAKKVAGEQSEEPTTLPQPKTKEEYDQLKSGTKYIDPQGVERTKK